MSHDLVRVHLATREATTPVVVPGAIVSAAGDLVFTAEGLWDDGWTWRTSIVALSVDAATATPLDRRALPDGAYDLRAAGATLHYVATTPWDGGGGGVPPPMILPGEDGPWPAFPADLTSIMVVTATQCRGTILIHEKMFESRMFFTDKLVAMGARIILCDPHRAVVVATRRRDRVHRTAGWRDRVLREVRQVGRSGRSCPRRSAGATAGQQRVGVVVAGWPARGRGVDARSLCGVHLDRRARGCSPASQAGGSSCRGLPARTRLES